MEAEIWKAVNDCDGKYYVSNFGNVLGPRNRLLNPYLNNKGYLIVSLIVRGERQRCLVHRLVAMAFLENPNEYPQINHKDENKLNNRADNLEWCSGRYNLFYGDRMKRQKKPVLQFDKNGDLVNRWESVSSASRGTGIRIGDISRCCNRRRMHAGGYCWKFE